MTAESDPATTAPAATDPAATDPAATDPAAIDPAAPRPAVRLLRNGVYLRLFSAQVLALLGTGLLTVALGLLAFELAGADAGVVLGTALFLKMVAYVLVSPLLAALLAAVPRKAVLIGADLLRASVALGLPFVTEVWQIYLLVFLLQSASAAFTPAFQALLPSILPEEREYTRALSLSRLAYDLEAVLSPVLAAGLLLVLSYSHLFLGTVLGFLASAALVLSARVPAMAAVAPSPFLARLTRGVRLFFSRAELRALLALNLAVSTATAMVMVNTVVLVKDRLLLDDGAVALTLGAFGLGSMAVALTMPRMLELRPERPLMLGGALLLPLALLATAGVLALPASGLSWTLLLLCWVLAGAGNAAVLTPSARLLRRASREEERPALFAAQFSLSHASYLLAYPLAGLGGMAIGPAGISLLLAGIAVVALMLAMRLWREPGRVTAPRAVPADRGGRAR